MSDPMPDAYTLYLDMPPGPRPPNHYDLLELELFCSHHERINHAARKQFRLIKPYQDHPERATREIIQDIMSAIATARVVLTNPTRKEEYDRLIAADLNIDRDKHLAGQLAAPLPDFEIRVIAGPSLVDQRVQLVEGTVYTLGSDTHCTLPLKCGRVSEKHCRIEFAEGDWWVRSVKPRQPIFTNNEPCGESVLNDADFFDVGGYRLRMSRIDRQPRAKPAKALIAPPLSMIIQRGISIASPTFNILPPQRVLIGSADTVLWQLPDPSVAGCHCAVQSVGDNWEVEDLGASGGTSVNGTEIMRHIFHDRDVLTIGQFDILVSLRF